MPGLYQSADVAVMPSWSLPCDRDPCPLVVLEAMSAGKAIVASAVGGTPELIADDQTGVLLPPRDPAALATAVGDLLADGSRRERLGRGPAQARARERFTIERYCRDLEAVLVGVTRGPKPAPAPRAVRRSTAPVTSRRPAGACGRPGWLGGRDEGGGCGSQDQCRRTGVLCRAVHRSDHRERAQAQTLAGWD